MPIHYLIPYVSLKNHKDPDLKELSYGEGGKRGEILKANLSKGSYLFFHTRIGSTKYITGYIVVDKIISGKEARKNPSIHGDGRNDDWMFLGDKSKSKRLRKPIPFNKNLAEKLSININFESFERGERTEAGVIGLATRALRQLKERDISTLLNEINSCAANTKLENSEDVQSHLIYDENENVIPMDEIHKIKENEIKKLLRMNPDSIEDGCRVIDYEKALPDGDMFDLLLESKRKELVVAEVKGPNKLNDEITTQIASYVRDIEKQYPQRKVRKMIICDGKISPKLQKACESFGIEIIVYGLRIDCFKLQ